MPLTRPALISGGEAAVHKTTELFYMGFFRKQEEKVAIRLLAWQYQRMGKPLLPYSEMEKLAAQLVEDAHQIAKDRGGNIVSILKDLVGELRK
jgi:hypothetical protein